MYPSLRDYLQAIELSTNTLRTLHQLSPLRKPDGSLFFSSGNFAVVFRMQDRRTGEEVALRCFLREVPRRQTRLALIARYLTFHPSPYLRPFTYHPSEIWVDTQGGTAAEFDVVSMPWIEGETLARYVAELCRRHDRKALHELAGRFDALAHWLIRQPFAHGDLKPDNVLVTPTGQLVLVDYDGCYVPSLDGLMASETGTLPYRHPRRTPAFYNRHLDDFSLLVLSLELWALSREPDLYRDADSLLVLPDDMEHPFDSARWGQLRQLRSRAVSGRAGLLEHTLHSDPGPILPLKNLLSGARQTVSELLIPVRKGTKWGFVNPDRAMQIPFEFDDTGLFAEGLAPVRKGGKYGYINPQGETVIPFQFDKAFDFSEGLALVWQQGKWGFLSIQGDVVIPCQFEGVSRFSQGLACVKKGGRYGYIDRRGEAVIPVQFESAWSFSEGLACVRIKGQYGFIDPQGQIVIPCELEFATPFAERAAVVKKGNRYGFMDPQGGAVFSETFDEAAGFSEGLAAVCQGTQWGFIDRQGQVVIPFQFEDAGPFSQGLAGVRKQHQWGYINLQGQPLVGYSFDQAFPFRRELALVRQHDQFFYLDREGTLYRE